MGENVRSNTGYSWTGENMFGLDLNTKLHLEQGGKFRDVTWQRRSGTTVAQNQVRQCGERLTRRDRKKMKGEKLGWAVRHAPKVQNMHFSLAQSSHQTASSILDGSPLVLCLTQNGTHTEGTGLYRAIFLLHFTLCGSRRGLFWWKLRNRWHLNQGKRKTF